MFFGRDSEPLVLHRAPVLKHMQGKHDQQSHAGARRRIGTDTSGAAGARKPKAGFEVASAIKGATPASLLAEALANGGLSRNFMGEAPTSGYIVAMKGHELKVSAKEMEERGPEVIFEYLKAHQDVLRAQTEDPRRGVPPERRFFGAWFDSDTGDWYLDISEQYRHLAQAAYISREREQLALWDVKNMKAVPQDDPLATSAANYWANQQAIIKNPAKATLDKPLPVDWELYRAHLVEEGLMVPRPPRPPAVRLSTGPSRWQRTLNALFGDM